VSPRFKLVRYGVGQVGRAKSRMPKSETERVESGQRGSGDKGIGRSCSQEKRSEKGEESLISFKLSSP
jgi:hypothetical protein